MAKFSDCKNIKVLKFLDAYEKQQSLWNPALESYKNKQARDEAYLNIIRELNLPSLTVHDVKLKVKSIRTTYTKELRTLTKYSEEGKSYSPKLFWFSRANSFLKNVSLSRDRRSSNAEKISIETEDLKNTCEVDYMTDISCRENLCQPSVINSSPIRSPEMITQMHVQPTQICNSPPRHKTEESMSMSCNESPAKIDEPQPNSNLNIKTFPVANQQANDSFKEEEYEMFCRSVAAQLRSIPDPYSRAVAKLKIQQILFEAETGHYQNSTVTIPAN